MNNEESKPQRVRLNQTLVDNLPVTGKFYAVADSEAVGLQVRVTPNGVKTFSVRCRLANGKRVGVTLGRAGKRGLTVDRARTLAQRKIGEMKGGINPNDVKRDERKKAKEKAMTLEAFLDGTYKRWATANRKDGARNVPRLKASFKDLLSKPLKEITAKDVEDWRAERIRKKWSKASKSKETVNRTRATGSRDIAILKSCLSRAVQFGFIESNPLRGEHGVKLPKVDRKSTIRPITEDEEKALFKALVKREADQREARGSHNTWLRERHTEEMAPLGTFTDYLRPYITLLLHTGLRRNEGFQLRWADINFKEGELKVRAGVAKSGRERTVPLNSLALDTLKVWRDQFDAKESNDLVFPSPQTGEALTHINTAWRNVTKDAGLKGLRLHDLRHTFATRVLANGATISELQSLMGHADITTTAIYLHPGKEGKRRAVNALVASSVENVVSFPTKAEEGKTEEVAG